MKKTILLVISLIIFNFSLLAQTSNTATLSVPSNTTAFGVNMPAGNQIYDFSTFKLYILKQAATKLQSISTSSVILVTLNDSVAKNKADIATNTGNINTNTTNISANTAKDAIQDDTLAVHNTRILAIKSANITNALNITTNTGNINTNTTNISANTAKDAIQDDTLAVHNTRILAIKSANITNALNITTNTGNINTNTTNISANTAKDAIQDDTLAVHNTRILAIKSSSSTNVTNITINSDSIAALRADISNTALNEVERFSSIQGQAKFGLTSALTINNLIFLNGNLVDISQYFGVGTDTLTFKTPLSIYDNLVVFYQVGANTSNQIYWYGVEWDTAVADPSITRIGNVQYQASLPIQNGMVRAVFNDDRTVSYYLDPNNSNKKADGTTANLTGADGQVEVIVPTHWERFERVGAKRRIELSTVALPGFTKIQKYAIGAYEAYYNTTTGKLESRSGVMPTTNKTRANFRTYAAARGPGWHELDYNSYFDIFCLYLTEYASFDSQTVLPGATNATSADWSAYNGSNPVIATGASNAYGNASASVPFSVANFVGGTSPLNSHEADYRGIENVYGHIWKFVDGININYVSATEAYVYTDSDPSTFADDTPTNYVLAGKITNSSGYITSLLDNSILPQTVSGSSSTYMTDYTWASSSQSGVWRVALWGASLADSSNGGFLAAYFTDTSGGVNPNVGGRLCLKIE